ncbi:MAG TPA: hypothetical protein VN046_03875 [Stenotrophobium sp.]|nr:hypothetical protein [Stenotrophobium sp.]
MSGLADHLRRRTAPSTVVALSRLQWPRRLRSALRHALGRRVRIELFFAFDDPYSAIALPGLIRLARTYEAELAIHPLVERGIVDDPAASPRRLHAVHDCRRLAQRDGLDLSRHQPLPAGDCAFLAAWTEAARGSDGMVAFAAAALKQLWMQGSGPVRQADFHALHLQYLGKPAPAQAPVNAKTLAANTARLHRLGHWESPAARIDRQWFFAHERLPQMSDLLARLGANTA